MNARVDAEVDVEVAAAAEIAAAENAAAKNAAADNAMMFPSERGRILLLSFLQMVARPACAGNIC
jgi:hypothetical protein